MSALKLTLSFTKMFSHREIIVFECKKCGHKRLFKHYIDKNDEIFTRWHYGKKYVDEELKELESQIENTEKGFDKFLVIAGEFTKRISRGVQAKFT